MGLRVDFLCCVRLRNSVLSKKTKSIDNKFYFTIDELTSKGILNTVVIGPQRIPTTLNKQVSGWTHPIFSQEKRFEAGAGSKETGREDSQLILAQVQPLEAAQAAQKDQSADKFCLRYSHWRLLRLHRRISQQLILAQVQPLEAAQAAQKDQLADWLCPRYRYWRLHQCTGYTDCTEGSVS